MRPFLRTALIGAVTTALVAVAVQPATATSQWDLDYSASSNSLVGYLGFGGAATIGQTFVVPDGPAALDTFSLKLTAPTTTAFRAVLQQWDPTTSHATGAPLYMSDPMSTGGTERETVTVSPHVAVQPGTYVAYLTLSYDWETQLAGSSWFASSATPYADGEAVGFLNGTDESRLTVAPWILVNADLAFSVVFSGPVQPPVGPPVGPPVNPPVAPPVTPLPTTPAAAPVVMPPAYTG